MGRFLNLRIILQIFFIFSVLCNTNSQTLKIMPIGNSLTKGSYCLNGSISSCIKLEDYDYIGYRYHLYQRLKNEGYTFDLVGSERAGYNHFDDPDHFGFAGSTTWEIYQKLKYDNNYFLKLFQPDIVLLEIGTNDVYGGLTGINNVTGILNEIQNYENFAGKKVLVLLSPIINFTQGTYNEQLVATFNSKLRDLYENRISQGDLIVWIPMGSGLDYRYESAGGDMMDELHPNQGGYDKIGENWFKKIDSYNHTPSTTPLSDDSTVIGGTFKTINLNNHISDVEDPDSEITWAVNPSPTFFNVSINAQKIATITPLNPYWTGSETINFVARDRGGMVSGYGLFTGLAKSATLSAEFKVYNPNSPPSLIIPEERETYVGDIFELILDATDPDVSDNPVISAKQLPAWLNYNPSSTTLYGMAGSTHTGTNTVKMTVSDGKVSVDTTFYLTVIPKSNINDLNGSQQKFRIYPNPVSGEIIIIVPENSNYSPILTLYSITGFTVAEINLYQGDNLIDLSSYNLSPGLYIYKVEDGNYTERGKLIIKEK